MTIDELAAQILSGPGRSLPSLRAAAATRADLPAELRALVEKIHRHAYKVTAEEIDALKKTHSEDVLFEVIVAAALGAARDRCDAGLRALEGAK
jgi:hypothetical protein